MGSRNTNEIFHLIAKYILFHCLIRTLHILVYLKRIMELFHQLNNLVSEIESAIQENKCFECGHTQLNGAFVKELDISKTELNVSTMMQGSQVGYEGNENDVKIHNKDSFTKDKEGNALPFIDSSARPKKRKRLSVETNAFNCEKCNHATTQQGNLHRYIKYIHDEINVSRVELLN